VYDFGGAPGKPGGPAAVAGHGGVVAAVPTSGGDGLWLVTADGTIAPVGDAPDLSFDRRPTAPVTGAAGLRDAIGLWATTASGEVLPAGAAAGYGDVSARTGERVVGIAGARNDRGYLLATADGHVFAFGSARGRLPGVAASREGHPGVVGIATVAKGDGYWLADADGRVFAFGDAPYRGSARWHPPPGPYGAVAPAPGPAAGIVARPGARGGYWVFGTTGRVVARGAAPDYGGDSNLALFTQ
jgi:hypothetical protein